MELNDNISGLGIPHLGSEFTDVIAFVFDSPRETSLNATAADILPKNIIEAKSFRFNLDQKSVSNNRFAGEGADRANISIGQVSLRGTLNTVLMQPISGWVTPLFSLIWDRTRLSWWGTATACQGNLISSVGIGATILTTDNISDFAALPTPFNLKILSDTETPEELSVTNVIKSNRYLYLNSSCSAAHTVSATTLSTLPYNTTYGPVREPAFSLMSLREGLITPCLINKLNIDANAGQDVEINIDFNGLNIYRDAQIDLKARRQTLINEVFKIHDPTRIVNGTTVKLSLATSNSGNFGLATALGDPILSGFQGQSISNFVITGVSLTIENNLKEVYTSHSINLNVQKRRRENSYPYALVSEGRTISGKIRYRSPIDFWSNLERIAGPSSINGGGLIIDFGNFKITMNEIAWQPSTSDGDMQTQTREISFTMVAETRNAMPLLEFSEQV